MASGAVTALIANPSLAADDRASCFGDGTNNTNVLGNFTLTNTSKVDALPTEAHGRYVRLLNNGSTMYYYFTFLSSATIATPPAATDAGARAATQGEGPYPDGSVVEVRVPHPPSGGRVYFARIGGTASQSVQVVLADGTVGLTGP
jgi:hypothetical protein